MDLNVSFIRLSIKNHLYDIVIMEQLFDKYNSLYKQEFVEDDDNECGFSLENYNFKTPIEYTSLDSNVPLAGKFITLTPAV